MKNKLIVIFIMLCSLIVFIKYQAWINLVLIIGVISLISLSIGSERFIRIRNDYSFRVECVQTPFDLISITEGFNDEKSYEENCLSFQSKFKNKTEKEFFRYLAACSSLNKVKRLLYVYKDYGNIYLSKYLSFGIFVGTYFLLIKLFSFYLNLLNVFFILVTIFLVVLIFSTLIDTSYLPSRFSFYHQVLLKTLEEDEMVSLKETADKKKNKIYKEIVNNFKEGKLGEYHLSKSYQEKINSLYQLVKCKTFIAPKETKITWYYLLTEYIVFVLAVVLIIKGLLI